MEIDHIFICTQQGSPEADVLKLWGLTEGTSNIHLGQGTANRRFFFKNFFIELLYLENKDEAQNELTTPTLLYERLAVKNNEISPFGVCFRPKSVDDKTVKFPNWSYKPQYLPPHLEINIAENTSLCEPMWFYLSFASRPDLLPSDKKQPFIHMNGLSEVTFIQIRIPNLEKNLSLKCIQGIENFNVINGKEHLLEVSFDNEKQGLIHDFRPILPLVFKY